MALGFKIADGYVDVHAKYDKSELQKAARDAADDSDKAFNEERVRNSKSSDSRAAGRKVGGQAGIEFTKGMQQQIARDRDKPIISIDRVKKDASMLGRVHVAEFHRAVEEGYVRQEGRVLTLGRRFVQHLNTGFNREINQSFGKYRAMGKKISEVMFGRDNAAKAGSNFFKAFVEAVTFGQADFARPEIVGKLTKWGARLGSIAGVSLATALVFEAGNAITALLPLALGAAILAIPIADLIARNVDLEKGKLSFKKNNVGKALKDLIRTGQKLADTLGKAFSGTFISGLQHATMLMKALVGPMERAVRAISPGALAMWNGLLQAIMTFGMAFQPALKGINAGLAEWGRQLPIIGRKLGEMFALLLKNPQLVQNAVRGLSGVLQFVIGLAGKLIYFLTVVSAGYDVFMRLKQAGLQIVAGWLTMSSAIGRITAAWGPLKKAILDVWNALVKFAGSQNDQQAIQRLQNLVAKIKAVWKPLKEFLKTVWKEAWAKVKEIWNTYVKPWIDNTVIPWLKSKLKAGAKAAFKAMVDEAVKWLKSLPGKAEAELKKLIDKIKKKFDDMKKSAKDKAKQMVDDVIKKIKELPGKAAAAVATLWSKMSGKFKDAVSKAKAAAKDLVDGFIKKIKELPGKAASEAGKVKDKIKAKFSGAIGWLTSAGKAIIDGLKAGIKAATQGAIDAAVSAAKRAVAAAKAALKITSPSQVAAEEIGKPFAEGIGVGMRKHVSEEFKELPGMLPNMRGAKGSSGGSPKSYSSTFSPNINIHIAAGLNGVDAAARRALTKELFLEIEAYRKDYVK